MMIQETQFLKLNESASVHQKNIQQACKTVNDIGLPIMEILFSFMEKIQPQKFPKKQIAANSSTTA